MPVNTAAYFVVDYLIKGIVQRHVHSSQQGAFFLLMQGQILAGKIQHPQYQGEKNNEKCTQSQ